MQEQITIKLTKDQLQNIIDLIYNNNQFYETDEEKLYWDNLINTLERQI